MTYIIVLLCSMDMFSLLDIKLFGKNGGEEDYPFFKYMK